MDREIVAAELTKLMDPTNRVDPKITFKSYSGDAYLMHVPEIMCADGFHMSVQASHTHYCTPRDSTGPWDTVEVGYPSAKVDAFMPHIDGGPDTNPTDTVYGYVPIDLVVDAIIAHGGFADKNAVSAAVEA